MQDTRGFLHYPRNEPDKQTPRQRVRHWHEYERLLPEPTLRQQATRCMDCGTPACHSYCPVHNLIPDWNALISDGDWLHAYQQLESTNNFPEFTGRLCPAPCEDACTLRLAASPVTIRGIELAIIEHAWEAGWVQPQIPSQLPRHASGKRVAIVGSGPAGLACAQQLVRAGHAVTVYEQDDRIGGLLRYGIPDFRLDKACLERRLGQLRDEGVQFRTQVRVGVDIDARALRLSTHALVLACGARRSRDVQVPGRGLPGVHSALCYLTQQNRREAGDPVAPAACIDSRGKDVVVIGGGDTGADCVGTAIRQGARSVTQVQYHARPPLQGDVLWHWPEPVPEWHDNDHDAEGGQRLWSWNTVGFEAERGRVAYVDLQRLRWFETESGRWRHAPVSPHIRRLPAQLVLIAIGYRGPIQDDVIHALALDVTAAGLLDADAAGYQTNQDGVFACGDARRGQSLVVWAIREGRQCARAVDLTLRGASSLPAC